MLLSHRRVPDVKRYVARPSRCCNLRVLGVAPVQSQCTCRSMNTGVGMCLKINVLINRRLRTTTYETRLITIHRYTINIQHRHVTYFYNIGIIVIVYIKLLDIIIYVFLFYFTGRQSTT